MNPRERKYLVVLLVAVTLAVLAKWMAPKPIDWSWSLEQEDERPYGSVIAREVLPALFPNAQVNTKTLPPYLLLRDTTLRDINYVFVTQTFEPDPVEAEKLLDFVKRGNMLFVAAVAFQGAVADTLKLETTASGRGLLTSAIGEGDSLGVNFSSPSLRAVDDFVYLRGAAEYTFTRFDTSRTVVLGRTAQGAPNFIGVEWGHGRLYLNTLPLAFTNYHLLADHNAGYFYRALSYLPEQTTWWDEYYKPNRAQAGTPLRFILAHPSLKRAYYLMLLGTLLFVVFQGKRRQRIIPVLEPLRNTTLDFVRTIGRLYFENGDHANLAAKKILFFEDYLRTHLHLSAQAFDDDYLDRVAERSGVPREQVQTTFDVIREVQATPEITEAKLKHLNNHIEIFYRLSKR